MNEKKEQLLVLEKQLSELEVQECEVFSRVVGYFRPVKHWNAGKQDEFKNRKTYDSVKETLN
jgi:hypothetical protein